MTLEEISAETGATVQTLRYYVYRKKTLKPSGRHTEGAVTELRFDKSHAEQFIAWYKNKSYNRTTVAAELANRYTFKDADGWDNWLRSKIYSAKELSAPQNTDAWKAKLNRLINRDFSHILRPVRKIETAGATANGVAAGATATETT